MRAEQQRRKNFFETRWCLKYGKSWKLNEHQAPKSSCEKKKRMVNKKFHSSAHLCFSPQRATADLRYHTSKLRRREKMRAKSRSIHIWAGWKWASTGKQFQLKSENGRARDIMACGRCGKGSTFFSLLLHFIHFIYQAWPCWSAAALKFHSESVRTSYWSK